jgi:hypothetical protein
VPDVDRSALPLAQTAPAELAVGPEGGLDAGPVGLAVIARQAPLRRRSQRRGPGTGPGQPRVEVAPRQTPGRPARRAVQAQVHSFSTGSRGLVGRDPGPGMEAAARIRPAPMSRFTSPYGRTRDQNSWVSPMSFGLDVSGHRYRLRQTGAAIYEVTRSRAPYR